MIKKLVVFVFFLCVNITHAQFIKKQAFNLQIGYGISVPENTSGAVTFSGGFYGQADWILITKSWLELRPYLGYVSTNPIGERFPNDPPQEKGETRAFLLGGKFRLRAPIPYISPFLEMGVGASIGRFETSTIIDTIDRDGVIAHVPIAFGLGLGKENGVDLAFTYYYQVAVKQVAGAVYIGFRIPL